MKLLFILALLSYGNVPPVITGCRIDTGQVIWPFEEGMCQWPIRFNNKTYIHQLRPRKNGRGVEGNFYEK